MPENGPGQPASPPAEVHTPFYGWRYDKAAPDGGFDLDQVPLTLEDVLHPQEDDVIPENTQHEPDRGKITWWCRSRSDAWTGARSVRLHRGLGREEGVKNHSPDISVFDHLNQPLPDRLGTFPVKDYGAPLPAGHRSGFPEHPHNDVTHNCAKYYQVAAFLPNRGSENRRRTSRIAPYRIRRRAMR